MRKKSGAKKQISGRTAIAEDHDVLGGKAKIFRVQVSGKVWQFRIWIEQEKKYVRKSLKTRDYDTAIKIAEESVFKIYSDVASGRKIFGITVGELISQYLKWRKEDVEVSRITKERWLVLGSQLKHFGKILGEDKKVSELSYNSIFDYEIWRKKSSPKVRDITLRGEMSTINHMMANAWRKGLVHFNKFDFRKMKIDMTEEFKRRGIFSLEEYDDLVRFMRSYVSEKNCVDEADREERLMVRDCVLIAANTMLRVGELWQLRWQDIKQIKEVFDSEERKTTLVTIQVRGETSKNRRTRTVVSRGGEYFLRLKQRSKNTAEDDYIFPLLYGNRSSKNKRYDHWKNLMEGIGLDYKKRNVTWYSLRHFGITCRIRAGVSYLEIADLAGTGIQNIQSHYGHIDTAMKERSALKNFKIAKDGLLISD